MSKKQFKQLEDVVDETTDEFNTLKFPSQEELKVMFKKAQAMERMRRYLKVGSDEEVISRVEKLVNSIEKLEKEIRDHEDES